MPIFSNKSPSPHNNVKSHPVSNLGGIPDFKQTTGRIPGSAPEVEIPSTIAPFGNPKEALNNYPTIFKLNV